MESNDFYPKAPPHTTVLIGTGAIINSWNPVKRALNKSHFKVPDGEENLAFASIVFELRHRANMAHRWKIGKYGLSSSVRKKLGTSLKHYEELIKLISIELQEATNKGELEPRPYLYRLKKYINSEYTIITTNWDFVLESLFDKTYITHIHGDITAFDSLYLPAEVAWEPYRNLETGSIYVGLKPTPWKFWKWRRFTRPKQWDLSTSANWLISKTTRLIVTGLSFSALDAELGELILSIVNPDNYISHLVIIDLDPESVLNKIRFHARDRIRKTTLLQPDDPFLF